MHKMIRRRSVETWRELVARQVRIGLSVQAFCQQERLNAWTFYGWRSRLRGRTATAETAAVGGSSEPEPTAGFIDLGALGGNSSRCEIRVDLGGAYFLECSSPHSRKSFDGLQALVRHELRTANETLRHERDASHAVAVDAIGERETAHSAHAQALAALREIGDKYGVRIERGTQAEYAGLREAMKASGQASQQQYQQIKAAFDALQERRRRKRRPGIEGRACEDDGQERAPKARFTRERDEEARMTIWKDEAGREVLHVSRSRVEVLDHSANVETAALRIAAKKFGDAVSITGSAEFRERLARLATREGIRVADADLARIVQDERSRGAEQNPEPEPEPDNEQDLDLDEGR